MADCSAHQAAIAALSVVPLALLLTACSSFGREWKEASAGPTRSDDIAGRWDGEWRSAAKGHHGRLRAVVTSLGNDRFHVHYRATYQRIFRFRYEMDMTATADPQGQRRFSGEADLGIWGSYRCEGLANAQQFRATYDATFDRGTFDMSRPPPTPDH